MVLIAGVIGGLYAGVVTPTEGGAAGALLAIVIGLVQRKLSWAGFVDSFKDAISTTSQLFFIGIGAIIYTKFLALAGTADMFVSLIGQWALDPLLLVVAVSVIYVILYGANNSLSFRLFQDTYREGDPYNTGLTPPPGLYEPSGGFGKVLFAVSSSSFLRASSRALSRASSFASGPFCRCFSRSASRTRSAANRLPSAVSSSITSGTMPLAWIDAPLGV